MSPLSQRLQRDDVFSAGQHDAPDRDLVHIAYRLANDRKGVVPDLPVGTEVVRADQVTGIDLGFLDELVDLDRTGGFQRDLFELLLGDLDEGVLVEHVALDDILVWDLVAGVGVDLQVLDPMAGLPIELVEADLLALGGGRVEGNRTGDEGQTEETLPVGAGGHYAKLQFEQLGLKTNESCRFRHLHAPTGRSSQKRTAPPDSAPRPLDSTRTNREHWACQPRTRTP